MWNRFFLTFLFTPTWCALLLLAFSSSCRSYQQLRDLCSCRILVSSALWCKLNPPNILDLHPSAAVNTHTIYHLCWPSHTYSRCFTEHFYLSLTKGFSCMHLISPVCKSHTVSHQFTFSYLFCISSFWLFQHPIYLKISFHIPLWILSRSLWNKLHAFEQIMDSHIQTLKKKKKNAWILYAFIHKVRMSHLLDSFSAVWTDTH